MCYRSLQATLVREIGLLIPTKDLLDFLKMGVMCATFQTEGTFPESMDFWNKTCKCHRDLWRTFLITSWYAIWPGCLIFIYVEEEF